MMMFGLFGLSMLLSLSVLWFNCFCLLIVVLFLLIELLFILKSSLNVVFNMLQHCWCNIMTGC